MTPDPHLSTPAGKPRARSLGIPFGGTPGRWNAITDVPGLSVGYTTLIEGDAVRTGVTAIHPRGADAAGDPVAAGFFSLNGNGEMTGISWIAESGTFAGPVAITNTHAVGVAHAGIIAWAVQHHPKLAEVWLLPVAAETWDGYLNDINGHHVTEQTVVDALESAATGPAEEGSVGGGTGMNCYGFKGGSGTASRLVGYGPDTYTVGVFVQANFGRRPELTLAGVPLGQLLAGDNPMADYFASEHGTSPSQPSPGQPSPGQPSPSQSSPGQPSPSQPSPGQPSPSQPRQLPPGAGSVIALVGTDAPLLPHQCQALARRVTLGLARTGTTGSHFSGDLFLAFSTGNPGGITAGPSPTGPGHYDRVGFIPWNYIDPFYEAVVQATEEAVANALVANEDMTGRDGHHSPALPRDRVAALFSDQRDHKATS